MAELTLVCRYNLPILNKGQMAGCSLAIMPLAIKFAAVCVNELAMPLRSTLFTAFTFVHRSVF
jgi:hypothetical protein